MGYTVDVLPEVREDDLPLLLAEDPGLARVIAQIVANLHSDPWLGREMRERLRLEILADCRKVSFDVASWKGKPRYRLVYRNRPDDGAISVLTVLAVGPRSELAAYRKAATRAGAQKRAEQAAKRGGRRPTRQERAPKN